MVSIHQRGYTLLSATGRRPYASAKIDKAIVEFVEDGNYAHTPQVVNEFIKDEVISSLSAQNRDVEAVSSNFVRRLKHRLALIEVPAQLTTKARAEAEQACFPLLLLPLLLLLLKSALASLLMRM